MNRIRFAILPVHPYRQFVLTGQRGFTAERAEVVHSPAEALLTADEDSWVIGGESVYRMFLPLCDRVYVTRIAADGSARNGTNRPREPLL